MGAEQRIEDEGTRRCDCRRRRHCLDSSLDWSTPETTIQQYDTWKGPASEEG